MVTKKSNNVIISTTKFHLNPKFHRRKSANMAGKLQQSQNSKVTDFFVVSQKNETNKAPNNLSSPQCKTPSPEIEKTNADNMKQIEPSDNATVTDNHSSVNSDTNTSSPNQPDSTNDQEPRNNVIEPVESTPVSKVISKKDSPKPRSSQKLPTYKFVVQYKKGKPTYLDMIHQAILQIGDRTGSSIPALTKIMIENHDFLKEVSPKQFKTHFGLAIKVSFVCISHYSK